MMNLRNQWPSLAITSLLLFSFPAWTGESNAESIANCFIAINPSPGSDLGSVFSQINALPAGQQNAAYDQLAPSQFRGITVTQEQNTTNVRKAISRRLDERPFGECAVRPDKDWNVWVDAYADFARQRKKHHQVGYHASTGGGVIGFDVMPVDPLVVGLATGYTYSHINWRKDAGDGHVQAAYGSAYAGVSSKYIWTNMILLGGWLQEKGTRNISFPGVDRSATHSNNGGEAAAHIDLGFNKSVADVFYVHPFAGGDYIYIHEDSYTEHGAKSLDLQVDSNNSQLGRAEVGLKVSRCFDFHENSLAFDIRASWVREMRISGRRNHSSFKNTSCEFTTKGYFPYRSLLGVGTDIIGYFFEDTMSFAVGYDGEFGTNYKDQIASIHLDWRI